MPTGLGSRATFSCSHPSRSRGRWKRGTRAGTTRAVSRTTRAPTASATGAPQDRDPNDSGLVMPGSPHDRNVRTQEWFEPGVRVHAHVDQRSDSAWFEPGVYVGAQVIERSNSAPFGSQVQVRGIERLNSGWERTTSCALESGD